MLPKLKNRETLPGALPAAARALTHGRPARAWAPIPGKSFQSGRLGPQQDADPISRASLLLQVIGSFCFCFETGSHYEARLVLNSPTPCLSLESTDYRCVPP